MQKNFICDHCYGAFRSGYHLKRHILIHTGMAYAWNNFSSHWSQSSFYWQNILNELWSHSQHLSWTESRRVPQLCAFCNGLLKALFGCSFASQLIGVYGGFELKLVLFGLGEKPYACAVCDMRFIQRYHLERHSLIHTGMRPSTVPILHKFDYACSLSHKSRNRCWRFIFVCGQ